MENAPKREEIEIETLARLVKTGFDRTDKGFEEMRAGFTAVDERFVAIDRKFMDVNKRIDNLSYKVDQLDLKLEAHRQETKDGFAAVRAVVGGMSHTLADHEERIKMLEGE